VIGQGQVEGQSKGSQAKRLADFESAIELVHQHTLRYPGKLAHVACSNYQAHGNRVEQVCPDSVLRRMVGALTVCSRPTGLGVENWREFTVNIENTDLSQVAGIYVYGRDTDWYRPLQATPLLHRCTALRS